MTLIEQLRLLEKALDAYRQKYQARVQIASDPADVFSQLTSKPGSPQAFIQFEAEDPIEENLVTRTFLIIISRGRGLTLDPADNLLKGASGGPPLYEILEEICRTVRALRFTPHPKSSPPARSEVLMTYKGSRPWRGRADLPLDAQEVEWALDVRL